MSRAILLTCPVCEATRALPGDRDNHPKTELLELADAHLDAHDLSESARALRKHETVTNAVERIVTDAELDDFPTDGWAAVASA